MCSLTLSKITGRRSHGGIGAGSSLLHTEGRGFESRLCQGWVWPEWHNCLVSPREGGRSQQGLDRHILSTSGAWNHSTQYRWHGLEKACVILDCKILPGAAGDGVYAWGNWVWVWLATKLGEKRRQNLLKKKKKITGRDSMLLCTRWRVPIIMKPWFCWNYFFIKWLLRF